MNILGGRKASSHPHPSFPLFSSIPHPSACMETLERQAGSPARPHASFPPPCIKCQIQQKFRYLLKLFPGRNAYSWDNASLDASNLLANLIPLSSVKMEAADAQLGSYGKERVRGGGTRRGYRRRLHFTLFIEPSLTGP